LDYYSKHGVEVAFERYGIFDAIRQRGFTGLEMELDPSDKRRKVLRVRGRAGGGGEPLLLVELVLRRRFVPSFIPERARTEVLFVEWLLLQDPTRTFTLARPPLPGQEHPGLGIARELQELLVQACRRLGLVGLMDRPAHYHNAVLAAAEWRFLDPLAEGRFRAFRAVLEGRDLLEASRIVENGALALADGTPVSWWAADHLLPVEAAAREALASPAYVDAVRAERARLLEAGLHVRAPETAVEG
jgi:hypothetical protein